jgi:hypothetical protein
VPPFDLLYTSDRSGLRILSSLCRSGSRCGSGFSSDLDLAPYSGFGDGGATPTERRRASTKTRPILRGGRRLFVTFVLLVASPAFVCWLELRDPLAALPRATENAVATGLAAPEPRDGRTLQHVVLDAPGVGQIGLAISLPDPLTGQRQIPNCRDHRPPATSSPPSRSPQPDYGLGLIPRPSEKRAAGSCRQIGSVSGFQRSGENAVSRILSTTRKVISAAAIR